MSKQTPQGHYVAEQIIQTGGSESLMDKEQTRLCLKYLEEKGIEALALDSYVTGMCFVEAQNYEAEDQNLDQLGGPNDYE